MSRYHDRGPPRRDNRHYSDHTRRYDDKSSPKREGFGELAQISGPGRHVSGYPSQIADACFQSADLQDANMQLQLILGIKPNGASEVLIPTAIARLSRLQRNGERRDALDTFSSFSPITFARRELLETFLDDHTSRKKKGSRANKGYELGSFPYSLENENGRCNYERVRTIFRGLLNKLPYSPTLYGFSSALPQATISEFLLITHNTYRLGREMGFIDAAWGVLDTKYLREQGADPEVLRPRVEQDLDFQNNMLAGDRVKKPCAHVATTLVDDPDDSKITLKQYLQKAFARSSDAGPLCIITYDWEKTRNLLSQMDINTSSWSTDLRGILKSVRPGNYPEDQKGNTRDRSRSPSRHSSDRHVPNLAPPRDRQSPSSVYVIDVKSLYTAVRKTGSPSERIVEACRDFDLPEVDEGDLKVVCAGNEVNFLWNLFVKIADGSSVDQMYDAQFKGKSVALNDDSDDEEDDDEDSSRDVAGPAPQAKAMNPYEFEEGLLSD